MTYVIDASIAACWCYEDEEDARADAARDLLLLDGRALAPLHWWFELRNVLLIGERRNRISQQASADFLDRIARANIDLLALPPAHEVFAIARKHRLTFYDATYLELAMRESVALATLDVKLMSAARAERVPLIGMS